MKLKKLSGLLSAVLAGAMVLSMAPAAFAAATDELPATCNHIQQVPVDNGDGTCSYVCKVDGTVIDTMEHVWDNDGHCVRCNAERPATDTSDCDHSGQNWLYESFGSDTHNVVCKDCGETVSTDVPCFFRKDGTCICGNTKPTDTSDCDHSANHWTYKDNGNGTHDVICADCDETVTVGASCVYTNGKCICGAVEPEEVGTTYTVIDATHHHVHAVYEDGTVYDADVDCVFETGTCVCGNTKPTHEHTSFTYEDNGNGTHKVICADCGEVVTEAAACVYGEDGNGTCACGAEFVCDHMGNHWKYVDNGNGTHNVVCEDCGAVVSENVACNYEDGVCITCGAKQPVNPAEPDKPATKPDGSIDSDFGMGYRPIREFFRALFSFLFGRR